MRQLFIGSEGTLGVITGCSLALPPLPSSVHLAFLGLASYAQVLAHISPYLPSPATSP